MPKPPTPPPTDVIFRRWPESKGGDIIALFPAEPGDTNPSTCCSYQHTGQHGAATVDLTRDTEPATPEQYEELRQELTRIGYNLRVVNRMTKRHRAARVAELNRVYKGAGQ